MVWPPDSPWAPWWRTSDAKIRESLKLAKVKKGDIVYDLGSGDGRMLIIAAREFGARGLGIEIDPLRAFISKILVRFNRVSDRVEIVRRSFFDVDISDATVVFMYLVPKALERLKPKLLKELKPGTRIVTVTYPIPGGLNNKVSKEEPKSLGIKKSFHLYALLKKDTRKIFLYIIPKK